jgi:hypothetical protein
MLKRGESCAVPTITLTDVGSILLHVSYRSRSGLITKPIIRKYLYHQKRSGNTKYHSAFYSTRSIYIHRGAYKSLARPGREKAAHVKSVMGRGMD